MYKDKDKQREANRQAAKRYRQRKGMTQGMTVSKGSSVIPDGSADVAPVKTLHKAISQHHNPMKVGYEPLR